jgi:WhiB family transcriptional regulator, redox-sensing transcriptional regulator
MPGSPQPGWPVNDSGRAQPRIPQRAVCDWSWQLEASCRTADPALFFQPERERAEDRDRRQVKAKAVCAECPVVAECRRHSLCFPELFGIWGGLSELERHRAIGLKRDHHGHDLVVAEN